MSSRTLEVIREHAEALSQDEKLELALYLIAGARQSKYQVPITDLAPFYGTTEFGMDAMEFQQQVRAEWDRGA